MFVEDICHAVNYLKERHSSGVRRPISLFKKLSALNHDDHLVNFKIGCSSKESELFSKTDERGRSDLLKTFLLILHF